ncbi:hypothetical protein CCM_02846 [Cordyceps militaris CM01]|uniref:Uncharacterized protein n=1 Tax=Cordyceps militaris (strain CM01) TaxID=983644 RepID=G3JC60_CORMM|nr:uncharacterized protein CCM_02846 [Cordyceps militaris CM01]EGX94575.1 hypothetical protein CCM_02846 [Cordyceps militaris CM01]
MHRFSLNVLAPALLYSHGALAVEFAQLAIGWCLDHPGAEAGKIVCKASGQTGSTNPDAVACVSYGECDCSRFKDDGSNEYFQCISNPNCAACTSPDATPAPPASSIYGLETVAPGTYSVTFDGTIKTVVVPSPTATTTELITVTAMSTLTLTITQDPTTRTTRVQTSTHKTTTSTLPTQTTADTTGSTAPVPTAPPTCPSYCTCEPKYGYPDTYENCLQQPECAGCGIPFPPLPDPVPEPTTFWKNSTTTSSTKPTPSCSASCDCSQIKDKSSDAYFQCITDPNLYNYICTSYI